MSCNAIKKNKRYRRENSRTEWQQH